ncbi:MAG: hypothetical protein HFJ07_06565 [Lachnospiraceae bacterium]|nr:hypothetical protein [Lachnospiraceae bacterium]
MDNKDDLIDIYGEQSEIFSKSYFMMGRLLDKNFIKKEIQKRELSDIYIYGGGYLGIQLYRAIIPYVNVLSVVDKKGKLMIEMEDIPIMDMVNFRTYYKDQEVIVTPLKFYREIYYELKTFITEEKIIFLEEFGGR